MKACLASAFALALCACATDNVVATPVAASVETAPMTGQGDAADDPAVWVHPTDASRSLILGTNKDIGVYVYGLDGAEKDRHFLGAQRLAVGEHIRLGRAHIVQRLESVENLLGDRDPVG